MTQADPSDDASRADEDVALARLEHKLCVLEQAVHELYELLAEETFPPRRPTGRSRRHPRHSVKLYVITGGALALLGLTPVLPAENPVRTAVDYTIAALIQQMPSSIPDPPDLGPIVIGNPDSQHQPLHPIAAVKSVLPTASPSAPAQASPSPLPTSLPIVAPALVDQDSHHEAASAPTSAPITPASTTPLPSAPPSQGPASTSAGAGPVSNNKRGRKRTSPTPSSSLGPAPSPSP